MTQMSSGRMKLAEHARNVHIVSVPAGVTLEQAMVPAFWAHVAHMIKPKDRFELWAEDRSWFADVIVIKASRLEVHIRPVAYLDMEAVAAAAPAARSSGYHVDYGGPVDQHRVIRTGDARIMTLGLTKAEAEQWINDQVAVETGRLTPMPSQVVAQGAGEVIGSGGGGGAYSAQAKTELFRDTATDEVYVGDAETGEPAIPDNWRSLTWQDRRSLASKLTSDPIHNGDEANAAIEAALAKRAENKAA